ncbi:MAG: hypothetical protein Kow0031_30010 [Anaerolineae bacterium]
MINSLLQNSTDGKKRLVSTLVVSRPGVMRQSLRATLGAYPFVWVVATAGDGLTALNYTLQHQPDLLVIDSNLLPEEVEALLVAAKARMPAPRCLVCVQNQRDEARLQAAGADEIILRDSWAQQWQETLLRVTKKPAV